MKNANNMTQFSFGLTTGCPAAAPVGRKFSNEIENICIRESVFYLFLKLLFQYANKKERYSCNSCCWRRAPRPAANGVTQGRYTRALHQGAAVRSIPGVPRWGCPQNRFYVTGAHKIGNAERGICHKMDQGEGGRLRGMQQLEIRS